MQVIIHYLLFPGVTACGAEAGRNTTIHLGRAKCAYCRRALDAYQQKVTILVSKLGLAPQIGIAINEGLKGRKLDPGKVRLGVDGVRDSETD